jgi:hypothetical protein
MFGFSISVIIAAVVMVAALFGMVICVKKQRVNPRAQPFAIGLLIVVVLCAIFILSSTMGDGDTQKLMENELKYANAQGVIMGQTLAKNYQGSKALVITNKNYKKNKRAMTIIDGLKEGFGSKIDLAAIDFVEPPQMPGAPGGPDAPPMMIDEMMLTAEQFDALANAHPDCKLIISLIGLPMDAANMQLWAMEEDVRPKIALMNGEANRLKEAIFAGYIAALISYKPGVKFSEEPAPSDPKVAFDKRFIMITTQDIEKIAQEYPKLFGAP